MEIVHSDHTRIVLRNRDGKVISQGETGHYVFSFSLLHWPTNKDRQYVLHLADGKIRLFDFLGNTVAEYRAPLSEELLHVYGTMVKLSPNQAEYFAAIVQYRRLKRSVLYMYDNVAELVYQEVLPECYSSIAAMASADKQAETLLVGGNGEVLQYRLAVAR
jgi:hypothetical protein